MLVFPQIDPVAVALGPLKIHWYGLMYLVGIGGAWWLASRRLARFDAAWTRDTLSDLVFWAACGVVLGGRFGYVVFYNFEQFLADPLWLLRIWEGGMSFHGGFLGVLVAMALFARRSATHVLDLTDFIAPVVPIGLGAGRIGNFINGELWGRVTDVPWAFVVDGEARHPSQLYEACLEGAVLFAILWTYSARPRPRHAVSALFLLGYGVFRAAVEFVRTPDAHLGYLAFGWLTMGHVLTLPMIIAGIGLWWLAQRRAVER